MVNDDFPAFHPDLTRARRLPRTSATRGNRRLLRALTRIGRGRAPKHGELVDLADGVTVRVHRPAATDARTRGPAILHLHGGGLIIGSAVQGDALCRHLADELGAVVASVDYRMPPEHPYPTPLEDCYAALRWLAAQPDVDPQRIAVIGESAGGGLAASLALLARDRGEVTLAGQVLAYPMLDDRTPAGSGPDPRSLRLWNARSNRLGWGMYLGAGAAGPAATPLDSTTLELAVPARRADQGPNTLAGLPPTWIGVGTLDLFHDEDLKFARRLNEAGVPCELHVIPGAYHGFDRSEPAAAVSRDFVARQFSTLRGMLGAR
ncbi:alpha/beta hydrolase [Chryseoglobus sp. 28M-23]|uniref:alpha/beta hydrolase n=1 Tax=Chryseoglobus sp. 28M-23 TaxID=2772253 RepID=UPI0017471701|nr:alpha/beta hydrolase [Chryseoglobus sp. 28M-23]QOD93999.1 alpha/beta hydrolase [Chryseoglobus sp. 28M-23]